MVATTPGTQANGQRDYLPRVVDRELDELLAALPAVVLEGARGVGKTTSAERRAATVHRLDIPAQMVVAQADPERIVAGATPVLIDEWQPGTSCGEPSMPIARPAASCSPVRRLQATPRSTRAPVASSRSDSGP